MCIHAAIWSTAVAGYDIVRLYDVGVAGIHRLLSNVDVIRNADVVICVAGMDGALPSVVVREEAAFVRLNSICHA